jgi:hypothetical protein
MKNILILPCSQVKAEQKATAFHLYQGKGYMGIVRKYKEEELKNHFDIYFMSAKWGLLSSEDTIEPYEQPMDKNQLAILKNDSKLMNIAKGKISNFTKGSTINVVLPIAYKNLFYTYLGEKSSEFDILESSGGIGDQRGFLKRFIEEKIK